MHFTLHLTDGGTTPLNRYKGELQCLLCETVAVCLHFNYGYMIEKYDSEKKQQNFIHRSNASLLIMKFNIFQ